MNIYQVRHDTIHQYIQGSVPIRAAQAHEAVKQLISKHQEPVQPHDRVERQAARIRRQRRAFDDYIGLKERESRAQFVAEGIAGSVVVDEVVVQCNTPAW